MENLIGKNWKTTLVGLLGAIWLIVQPIISKGDFEIERDWKQLVYALLAGAFGLISKDHNVSGGTVLNSPNDASVVKESTKKDVE